ncbi:Acetate kinase [hydrothermal vent metagenome]|uniref:Acetate kinase n=1 Tax=hydrothermal vent metagenome TaxID=652676 RepID=A0A3B0YGU4_9ZZZZ
MKILVLNSGSSSLKFQLFEEADGNLHALASGLIEQIGAAESTSQLTFTDASGLKKKLRQQTHVIDHREAITQMTLLLKSSDTLADTNELIGIGHRVVHGGETFKQPSKIDNKVLAGIEELIPLAPLHNPANLMGIRMSMEYAEQIPQVAVFDTAFHHSIPQHAYLYALPFELYKQQKIRRYGFHGTSHSYVAQQAALHLDTPLENLKMITLHLGNGASAAAINHGDCIDTSMGMTPLEGLVMGTRSGDLDPAILLYLSRKTGMNIDELDTLLNKKSGLKGICGENDMRKISQAAEQGEPLSSLALKLFCYRLKKYIGAYIAALGGIDCIVFTGGIGENSAVVRQMSCDDMQWLNLDIDKQKNNKQQQGIFEIQTYNSQVKILVIPTNEEYEIARQTLQVINNSIRTTS